MASKSKPEDPAKPPAGGQIPPRFAKLKRFAWDWQEIGWLVVLFLGSMVGAGLSRVLGEASGQTPMSFFTDLAQLGAACAAACLLTWLIKRALIGDLSDGEVRSAIHQIRQNTDLAPGARFLLVLDAATSLLTYCAVLLTWSVLY